MNKGTSVIIALLVMVIIVLSVIAYQNSRSPIDKAADSLRDAGRGIKDAIDPRSPIEKVGDGIKDTINDIKN